MMGKTAARMMIGTALVTTQMDGNVISRRESRHGKRESRQSIRGGYPSSENDHSVDDEGNQRWRRFVRWMDFGIKKEATSWKERVASTPPTRFIEQTRILSPRWYSLRPQLTSSIAIYT